MNIYATLFLLDFPFTFCQIGGAESHTDLVSPLDRMLRQVWHRGGEAIWCFAGRCVADLAAHSLHSLGALAQHGYLTLQGPGSTDDGC